MTTRASVVLQTVEGQGLKVLARVGSGGEITMDSGPGARGASPVEAVLAALGGCTAMDVIGILRKQRQQVLGYEVVVEGERRAEHPRTFTKIEVLHRVTGRDLNPAAIAEAIRLSDTKYCSVHAMLAAGAEIASRFEILPA